MSSFQGVRRRSAACSARFADRASHYWNTPEAGGKVDKDTTTQVGRALAHGIELNGLLARGKGALGAHVRHPARLPQELRLAGITDMAGANRFLQGGLPATTQRPLRDPGRGPGHRLRLPPARSTTSCAVHEERTVSNDNTVRYKRLAPQGLRPSIPAGRHRRHYVKARVRANTPTAQWPSSIDVWRVPRRWPFDSQTREAA